MTFHGGYAADCCAGERAESGVEARQRLLRDIGHRRREIRVIRPSTGYRTPRRAAMYLPRTPPLKRDRSMSDQEIEEICMIRKKARLTALESYQALSVSGILVEAAGISSFQVVETSGPQTTEPIPRIVISNEQIPPSMTANFEVTETEAKEHYEAEAQVEGGVGDEGGGGDEAQVEGGGGDETESQTRDRSGDQGTPSDGIGHCDCGAEDY